jgi:hypothetical protein
MAKTITQLPDATTVGESDEMIVQQSGITKRATIGELKAQVATLGARDITVSTADRSITNTGNFALSFGTNNTERMRIDASGNVGVGTGSPLARLSIDRNEPSVVTNCLSLNNASGGSGSGTALNFYASPASQPFVGRINSLDDGNYGYGMVFSTKPSGSLGAGALAERMRIDASGNVGIGNTLASSPINKLTISDATAAAIRLKNNSNSNGFLINDSTTLGELNVVDARPLVFSTSNVERMRIDASGNVGIGTASPNAAAVLDVSSTTQGFLPPRMTTAQRDAITTPPAGLMVYNTSTNKLNFYNGTAWEAVTSS